MSSSNRLNKILSQLSHDIKRNKSLNSQPVGSDFGSSLDLTATPRLVCFVCAFTISTLHNKLFLQAITLSIQLYISIQLYVYKVELSSAHWQQNSGFLLTVNEITTPTKHDARKEYIYI